MPDLRGRAHPRVSGENPLPLNSYTMFGGSSPRERGKLVAIAALVAALGLIPA